MDTDPEGLTPPPKIKVLGSSSDHLIVSSGQTRLPVGAEIPLQLNYSALIRATAFPFVTKQIGWVVDAQRFAAFQPAECIV